MSSQTSKLGLIILCPIVLWLSTLWIAQDADHGQKQQLNYPTKPLTLRKGVAQNGWVRSPLSTSLLSNFYFQFAPKSLSRVETLFYDFDAAHLVRRELDLHESSASVSKTEHEAECLVLGRINSRLDAIVKEDGESLFAFNMLVSNRVGLFRLLPDTRPNKCFKVEQQHVPLDHIRSQKVSIIICYYNEAPSALLRTIHSILKRSRHELMEEIIIIDDHSDQGYDLERMRPYLAMDLVKLNRTQKREGLIRARQFGASLAKGDILIFLDSHVEANIGWLEPLIDTIQANETTIACPMIDLINAETLIYTASPMVRGGLTWSLHFKWDSVPSEHLKTADDFAKPITTPTMAGGLYAISRKYFHHLGAYDPGMNLWGGENIELSLRTWMCGGQIVILPCSRLGHIFRKRRPYGPEPGEPDSLLYNSHRSARVWLDAYISKFYGHQPDAASLNSGDVSERIELKQRLKCHDFDWFMDNVYPSLRSELAPVSSEKNQTLPTSERPSLFNVKPRSWTSKK